MNRLMASGWCRRATIYDPVEGAVRLDGVDLRSVADSELRRAVVMVTQESFLFSGSVADNIALATAGVSGDSASRSDVVAAARAATRQRGRHRRWCPHRADRGYRGLR
ncbi:MAG TPA: hypothetical protein VFN75_11470 [Pseudonocardiaceae bacterium]|nr:hypothetical protein [Pseudonocardiaceae bacterium]